MFPFRTARHVFICEWARSAWLRSASPGSGVRMLAKNRTGSAASQNQQINFSSLHPSKACLGRRHKFKVATLVSGNVNTLSIQATRCFRWGEAQTPSRLQSMCFSQICFPPLALVLALQATGRTEDSVVSWYGSHLGTLRTQAGRRGG